MKDYEKELLRDVGSRARYKRGDKLYNVGDIAGKVYLIETGMVGKASCSAAGDKISVVGFRMPGELLGLSDIFLRSVRSCMAVAIYDTTVYSVEKEALQELMNNNPFLLSKIVSILEFRGAKQGLNEII